ncbi:unnamed protein product [Heligmosomoides polygyrus]|uniref:Gnk2-homologous domain-containing protein n=1 Tax=Heligmosomoides polygyrus TaxID=6339 RepID=A0A183GRS4_HELPZ|nr:unnamed protein product [Heligmosomoides polygyrus]
MHASEGQNSRWEAFTKFGAATATEMTGKNFDKWLKDAGVLDSKNITSTMTGIAFSKVAGPKKKTTFEETKKVIIGVAEDRARQSKRTVQVCYPACPSEKMSVINYHSCQGTLTAPSCGQCKSLYRRYTCLNCLRDIP